MEMERKEEIQGSTRKLLDIVQGADIVQGTGLDSSKHKQLLQAQT